MSPKPGPQAVRRLVSKLRDFEQAHRYLIEKITATAIRYDAGQGHDLLSRRIRNVGLKRGHLHELTHDGRGLLLDQTSQLSMAGWTDRIDHVIDISEELDPPAVLLRPDGHMAWIGDDQQELHNQLPRWFGATIVAAEHPVAARQDRTYLRPGFDAAGALPHRPRHRTRPCPEIRKRLHENGPFGRRRS